MHGCTPELDRTVAKEPVDHHPQQSTGLSMTEPYPFPTSADEFADKRVLVTGGTRGPLRTPTASACTVRVRHPLKESAFPKAEWSFLREIRPPLRHR